MRTLGPTVQNGPISTSSSMTARLSTDAKFEIVVAIEVAPMLGFGNSIVVEYLSRGFRRTDLLASEPV
jgi:hypothetical protein